MLKCLKKILRCWTAARVRLVRKRLFTPMFCLWLGGCTTSELFTTNAPLSLNASQLEWLGDQIFRNECNRQPACLTSWNAGEEFPSLGIGHFIWYRDGQQGIYEETFPALLARLESHGQILPAWLDASGDQPWPDRESFLADQDSARMRELRQLLQHSGAEQTAFIVERFQRIVDQGLPGISEAENAAVRSSMNAIASENPPYGVYALIDYVHFKGEGTSERERYQDQGWGLLQVLQGMPPSSASALQDFVTSAKQVLSRRVANAPPERREDRWLQGWHNRVSTYLPSPP